MNKTVHILNYQLRPTSSVAIRVEKRIAINLHSGDIRCMNVERNHNSGVLTVHTKPRETVIFSVTSDLNFLADTSMHNHLYVNILVLGIVNKYGLREKFMMKMQHSFLKSSNNRDSHVEDPTTHCLTVLYVQTVGRLIVTRKICCVIKDIEWLQQDKSFNSSLWIDYKKNHGVLNFKLQPVSCSYADDHKFPCRDCGKMYAWKTSLIRHRREECGKEPQFQCPYCDKRTKLKCLKYMYEHPMGNKQKNSEAQIDFVASSSTLQFDVAEAHGIQGNWAVTHGQEIFACTSCGKVYRYYRNLQSHIRQECGKEPHLLCPYCPYRTKIKSNLKKHIQIKHPMTGTQIVM
ncbi:hypothetical protein B7P43_G11948 [Cryptotermes secundus]|uniref:C2H2-type domain-containing protein n=1 Tax=Cryptotermes secundus TaxID=105785 RepID=A0A2J7R9V9_9NEOP|nr:hypothetical protein B7P43_G11948 [Cryptotermes secundus]